MQLHTLLAAKLPVAPFFSTKQQTTAPSLSPSLPADDPHTKANLLLQAHLGRLPLPISDYITDTKGVLDNSLRILQVSCRFTVVYKCIACSYPPGAARTHTRLPSCICSSDCPLRRHVLCPCSRWWIFPRTPAGWTPRLRPWRWCRA